MIPARSFKTLRRSQRHTRWRGKSPARNTRNRNMAKVLVLYYSAYGHIETMAHAEAEGARAAGAQVDVKRVPELVPEDVARKSHYKLDQAAPIARIDDLADYDAIIIGAGTRF